MDHEIQVTSPGSAEVIQDLNQILSLVQQIQALGGGLGGGFGGVSGMPGAGVPVGGMSIGGNQVVQAGLAKFVSTTSYTRGAGGVPRSPVVAYSGEDFRAHHAEFWAARQMAESGFPIDSFIPATKRLPNMRWRDILNRPMRSSMASSLAPTLSRMGKRVVHGLHLGPLGGAVAFGVKAAVIYEIGSTVVKDAWGLATEQATTIDKEMSRLARLNAERSSRGNAMFDPRTLEIEEAFQQSWLRNTKWYQKLKHGAQVTYDVKGGWAEAQGRLHREFMQTPEAMTVMSEMLPRKRFFSSQSEFREAFVTANAEDSQEERMLLYERARVKRFNEFHPRGSRVRAPRGGG